MQFSYVVRCDLEDEALAERYLAWLLGGHLREVCARGSATAIVARIDHPTPRIETRYTFASREAYEIYDRDHAPRLRAEGASRFEHGVRFERSCGPILHVEGKA